METKKSKKLQLITRDDLDVDVMAEVELSRLQRQYRIMDGDREAYVEEMNVKLARQRKVIEALRKEHNTLIADNRVARSANNRIKDEKQIIAIEKLLKTYVIHREKIAQKKANIKETEYQIKKLEKQVFALRPKQVTDLQCKIRIQSGKKTIESLKNTLDNSVKRFCVTLAMNRKIREEIDHLLKEREYFNCLYEKKLRQLDAGKRFIFDLVERATTAYDQREEWCNKLTALHTRTHNDTVMHEREMRELQRRLDYDSCLHEFLQIKGQKRILKDLEIKEKKRRETERELEKKELKSYEDTLDMIKELTGEKNVERLVASYVKQEEENFALFNYVNELGTELEDLEMAIKLLLEEIEQQKEVNEMREKQQQKTVQTLNDELARAKLERNQAESELQNKKEELQGFLEEINGLFRLLDCKQGPVLELLERNVQITKNNVFVYLEVIEKKIEYILHKKIIDLI